MVPVVMAIVMMVMVVVQGDSGGCDGGNGEGMVVVV